MSLGINTVSPNIVDITMLHADKIYLILYIHVHRLIYMINNGILWYNLFTSQDVE